MGRLDIPKISKAFFATVMPFRTEEGKGRYDAYSFRSTIQEVLAAQEAAASNRRVDFEIYDHAKYAMVGLVDELAIVSDWVHRNDWAQEPLELSIFNTNVAGEDFFERLNKLRKQYSSTRSEEEKETILGALEVFYTCLECGFKGRHRGGGDGELNAIRSGLLTLLWPQGEGRDRTQLFPEAYGEGGRGQSAKKKFNFWPLLFVGSLVLVFLLYFGYQFLLGGKAREITKAVEARTEEALNPGGAGEGGN